MPFKDAKKRKEYMRKYMKERRAKIKTLEERVKRLEQKVFGDGKNEG